MLLWAGGGGSLTLLHFTLPGASWHLEEGWWICLPQVVDDKGNQQARELPVQEMVIFGGWVSTGVSLFHGMAGEEMSSGGEFLNDLYALDVDRLEWRRVIPKGTFLPEPRAAHTACVANRRMLVFGGQTTYEPVNELLEFNMDIVSWRRVKLRGSNPSARSGHACAVANQARVGPPGARVIMTDTSFGTNHLPGRFF